MGQIYNTNTQIAKYLQITQILDKLLEYKWNWIQHVSRMPRNRLPRVMKHYFPAGRRNHGRPLKRHLDTWDRNGSTSGPSPWQVYDDDDDDDDVDDILALIFDFFPINFNLLILFWNELYSVCGRNCILYITRYVWYIIWINFNI